MFKVPTTVQSLPPNKSTIPVFIFKFFFSNYFLKMANTWLDKQNPRMTSLLWQDGITRASLGVVSEFMLNR